VDAYVERFRGTFGHDAVRAGHLDTSHFGPICDTIEQVAPMRDRVVLSSGCGSAGDLAVCLERGAARVVGIEVDEDLVRLARARFADHPRAADVEIAHYQGRELPFEDERFDLIVSLHVIEHVADAESYLAELLLFLELPNRYYFREQHTLLPLVHMPPNRWRDRLIRLLTSAALRRLVGPVRCQKLTALLDLPHPTPAALIALAGRLGATRQVRLDEAVFCGPGRRPLPCEAAGKLGGLSRLWRLPTLRLVLRRSSDQARY